jgi:hypothetical protein
VFGHERVRQEHCVAVTALSIHTGKYAAAREPGRPKATALARPAGRHRIRQAPATRAPSRSFATWLAIELLPLRASRWPIWHIRQV